MNHLAHFHLSGSEEAVMIGNLISDSVKGTNWKAYPKRVAVGLLLHREIDYFTDTHPIMRRIIARNRPYAGKFSGPITDILCDHLLIQLWPKIEKTPIDAYILQTYEMLTDHLDMLPAPWPKRLEVLIQEDWLNKYRSRAGMEIILTGFAKRLPLPIQRDPLLASFFEENLEENMVDFEQFYAEIRAFCKHYLSKP